MANHLPPLTMAASYDVNGDEVWYLMSPNEVDARGLRAHVRDEDPGECLVVLPLSEVSDCPRCDNCGLPTANLFHVDENVYMCGPCERLTRHPGDIEWLAARDGEVDDGPMTTGCYMRRLGRAGY